MTILQLGGRCTPLSTARIVPGLFRVFDVASPDTHAPKRFQTTVPQQALFLMNSPFLLDQSRTRQSGSWTRTAAGSGSTSARPVPPDPGTRSFGAGVDSVASIHRTISIVGRWRRDGLGPAGPGSCCCPTSFCLWIEAMPSHPLLLSRRELLHRGGMGFGALALGTLLGEESPAAERTNPLAPQPRALPAQGPARDPPVHERRPLARRHVRSQAGARPICRSGTAGREPDRRSARRVQLFPRPINSTSTARAGLKSARFFRTSPAASTIWP